MLGHDVMMAYGSLDNSHVGLAMKLQEIGSETIYLHDLDHHFVIAADSAASA